MIVCLEIGFGLLLELYWISGWKIIWTKRRKWWNWIMDNSIWNSLIYQYVGHYPILTSTNTKISKINKNLLKVPPRTLFLIKPIFLHNLPTQIHIAILSTTKNTNTSILDLEMLRISVNFKNIKFIKIKIEIDGFYSNIDIHITIYNDYFGFESDNGSMLGWVWDELRV